MVRSNATNCFLKLMDVTETLGNITIRCLPCSKVTHSLRLWAPLNLGQDIKRAKKHKNSCKSLVSIHQSPMDLSSIYLVTPIENCYCAFCISVTGEEGVTGKRSLVVFRRTGLFFALGLLSNLDVVELR